LEIKTTSISDVFLIKPKVFNDERGVFFESFNKQIFKKNIDSEVNFVQDNQSLSHKGVLRGLHFQMPPHAQAKLVSVVRGSVLDVVVDLR
jgi:dTDP-4-dehydrorhamnose 3,5-epimerase